MRHRSFGLIPVVLLFSIPAAGAADRCSLKVIAELPVTMEGLRPIVVAKINGADARFVADSGAAYSMVSAATVSEFKLPQRRAPRGFSIHGIGGSTTPAIATVQTFTLANHPIHSVNFLIGGNEVGAEAVGLIGQDLMRRADVEFDLANGVLRLIEPEDCAERSRAYWAASKQFSTVDIDAPIRARPQPIGTAFVNGVKVRVDFDTGTPISVLSLSAAKRAGITPSSPGAKPAGTIYGLGRSTVDVWTAPLASFKIGGEDIQNTQVLIGDIRLPETDMLLGDDFFLSHRVYVANDQRKVYFTYNGGPVFDLRGTQSAQPDPASASPAAAAPAPTNTAAAPTNTAAGGLGDVSDLPTDAAGLMRRGTAYAARKDFDHALADLQRACELAPREPDYYYELGRVQWQSDQPDLALETFDRALTLKPDHINALFARALLRLQRHADIREELEGPRPASPP